MEYYDIFANLGFPVAVCAVLFYVVFKQNNETRKAIENNTKALLELTLMLKGK